jgi:hypothetical protein
MGKGIEAGRYILSGVWSGLPDAGMKMLMTEALPSQACGDAAPIGLLLRI